MLRWLPILALQCVVLVLVTSGPVEAMVTSALAVSATCLYAFVSWRAQKRLRDAEAGLTAELVHRASHDPITELPSRVVFTERLEQELRTVTTGTGALTLLELDLDGFKEVNDMFGHSCGDLVLLEVGRRVTSTLGSADLATRLGGDQFAVLLSGADADNAEATAVLLAEQLAEPYDLGGASVDLEVSIGLATAGPGDDATTVMRNADTAMYHAKEQRLGRAHYDEAQPMATVESLAGTRLSLLGDLRRALQDHEIVLYFQPKVDAVSGHVVGAEALARWQHPERGLLQPGTFIEMVDRTNLSRQFTNEVLDLALAQVSRWAADGLEIPVAVNLSRRSLFDPSLPASVARALVKHGVPPRLLCLEITETTMVSEPENVVQLLHQLRALGVTVSLDDFGTGYSSLSYLKDLPIDELKIDRSFVQHLTDASSRASILVSAAVDLAHNLGLSVVAEGVEDAETLEQLAELGCDVIQGYHVARPMPADQFAPWAGHAGSSAGPAAIESAG